MAAPPLSPAASDKLGLLSSGDSKKHGKIRKVFNQYSTKAVSALRDGLQQLVSTCHVLSYHVLLCEWSHLASVCAYFQVLSPDSLWMVLVHH